MACETPAVRTHFTDDEIQHEKSGYLYPPDDDNLLDHYLIKLLTDDALRRKFGKTARQWVLEKYSWDAVAERVLTALQKTATVKVR